MIALCPNQLIKLRMEQQPPSTTRQTSKNKKGRSQLLDEIRNLKDVIMRLEEKHITGEDSSESDDLEVKQKDSEIADKVNPQSEELEIESRLTSGADVYKQIKSDWRTRIVSQKKPKLSLEKKESSSTRQPVSSKPEPRTERKQSSQADNKSYLQFRSDSEQQEPAKTQFFAPVTSNHSKPAKETPEFHFRKIDLIPQLEQNHNKFRSYISSQRQNLLAARNSQLAINNKNTSISKEYDFTRTSQPELKAKEETYLTKQHRLISELSKIHITKDDNREELAAAGKKFLILFIPNFTEENVFTIKRYKNCIVFSLMPYQTKAAIWHFTGDFYCGNVALDENGKLEKNGNGLEIVKDRHFYQGGFISGKKNGKGKIVYESGDTYEGQWLQGQIYGFGRYVQQKQHRIFEGYWKKGQYCGQFFSNQAGPFQFPE